MSKRINNIFEEKLKFNKMLEAYKRAAKGKKENKEVILFEMDLANNTIQILKEIYENKYIVGEYRKFIIYEPKKRDIWSLPFKDRVMHQWYVEEFIKPIFLSKFIEDSYACLEGKGVHKAIKKLQVYMNKMYKQNKEFYILKCDVSKFFYSIDKDILFCIIKRKIKDKRFLDFTQTIIYQKTNKQKGIPIGNYTSQYFANIYLNELDHYIKEKLKVKYYIPYMQDFCLLLNSKQECKEVKNKIETFLDIKLKLKLNSKTNYFKNKQGVNFCGFKIYRNKILLLKQNKKKTYKKVKMWNKKFLKKKLDLKQANASLQSWIGHASHSSNLGLIQNVCKKCEWLYNEKYLLERGQI